MFGIRSSNSDYEFDSIQINSLMRANEFIREESIKELNWRKAAATVALGSLGAIGQAHADDAPTRRVTIGPDGQTTQSFAQHMAQQGATPSDNTSDRVMPNQDLNSVEKIEKSENGITIHYGGETYDAVEVPKDSPTPRGAKRLKVHQAQMGQRGIGNYLVYLLPNGKAFIYSK